MYMENNRKANEIIKNLPRGTKKIISEKTGLSLNTVCRYFKGSRTEIKTSKLIVDELLNIEKDYNKLLS